MTVSVIVITYNRASTLDRALRSILGQTFTDLDVIVVDDGSTDGTQGLMQGISDSRVRTLRHERHRGITAARNTGLDAIRGEWFTFVDSDDEIVPEAIGVLMGVLDTVNPSLTEIECNCVDAATGKFTGEGLDHDQNLDEATIVGKMKHDHWGIIKTSLLEGERFNEFLPGFEDVLWTKVRRRARSYYVHKALKIVHRGSGDRESVREWDPEESARIYRHLLDEKAWLENHERYRSGEFSRFSFWGMVYTLAADDRKSAEAYRVLFGRAQNSRSLSALAKGTWLGGPAAARGTIVAASALRSVRGAIRKRKSPGKAS
jgi:GalNAc5-diNAcBac-PP-undecaprenol beta-1,3-glucosyltransferase